MRRKDLIMRRKDLTMRRKDLIMRRKDLTMRRKDLTMRRKDLIMRRKYLIMRRKDIIMRRKDIIMRRKDLNMRRKDLIMRCLHMNRISILQKPFWQLCKNLKQSLIIFLKGFVIYIFNISLSLYKIIWDRAKHSFSLEKKKKMNIGS